MSGLLRLCGISVAVCAVVWGADAAQAPGRAAAANGRVATTNSARMPVMPTLPIISVGNIATNLPDDNGSQPSLPDDEPETPDEPDEPAEQDPECPDGGVKNSDYTVEMCMNDILRCVNNGALPNGMNDLFNKELRYAIENGMGLCAAQVEKCIKDVRRDCANVYRASADVWIDFNSRKVQPEYYNFVLRKTGLTPNQAENTCMLLDKNTYGTSFAAVANDGKTTTEYNQKVGAYNNQQGGALVKNNPQGVDVNDGNPGVDGSRGHYARWDATTATCLIRVAAYNKDKHISNNWLFGAVGDDKPAEVWKAAGTSFACNKDLFGFSLLNDTKTVAVVGIGGGTLVGAGVGAIAGHGKREFDCSRDNHREMLMAVLKADTQMVGKLNNHLENPINARGTTIDKSTCDAIVKLYDETFTDKIKFDAVITENCEIQVTLPKVLVGAGLDKVITESLGQNCANSSDSLNKVLGYLKEGNIKGAEEVLESFPAGEVKTALERAINQIKEYEDDISNKLPVVFSDDLKDLLVNGEKSNMAKSIGIGAAVGAGTGGLATAITAFVERNNITCRVGDGLDQVALGKSYTIGTLKDFYVKWNLRVPDVVLPTATVSDCTSWKNTCAMFTDLEQCEQAQIIYKPDQASPTSLIHSACSVMGSVCAENYPVAKSHGVCE